MRAMSLVVDDSPHVPSANAANLSDIQQSEINSLKTQLAQTNELLVQLMQQLSDIRGQVYSHSIVSTILTDYSASFGG